MFHFWLCIMELHDASGKDVAMGWCGGTWEVIGDNILAFRQIPNFINLLNIYTEQQSLKFY